jgi:hypothetical protein
MKLRGRKGVGWIAFSVLLVIVAALIVMVTANSIKQGATRQVGANSYGEKTLIIFAEAMPYLRTVPNLDLLPNIKSLCDQGSCFSMEPTPPTFTTMQNYVIASNNDPKDAAYEYNYVINETDWKKNKCSFAGEITSLGNQGAYDLLADAASKRRFAYYSFEDPDLERYAARIFPAIPTLLTQKDVVYTYVTDTDSHFTNMSAAYSDQNSPMTQKLREFDALLGILFMDMKRMGVYNNTNIILYGDHGMAWIKKYYYLDSMTAELGQIVNLRDVCYWNDAGTSLRFWILPRVPESKKAEMKEKISGYFSKKQDCFYAGTDEVLTANKMLKADKASNWLNLGDVLIAVKPDCKVNSRAATTQGGMAGFA